MKRFLLLIIPFFLFINCNRKLDVPNKPEVKINQLDTVPKSSAKGSNRADSLFNALITKYPSVFVSDSIEGTYTYFVQQALKTSNELMLFNFADIKNFEMTGGSEFLLTLTSSHIIGQFKVPQTHIDRLKKVIRPNDVYQSGHFVVRVKDLSNLKLESFGTFITGELIDYAIIY